MIGRFAVYAIGAYALTAVTEAALLSNANRVEGDNPDEEFWAAFVSNQLDMSVPASSPTISPRSSPTLPQSPEETAEPTVSITMPPVTSFPTTPITMTPTSSPGECVFNITIGCFYEDGSPCDTPISAEQVCTDRPFMMEMLYTGGRCDQSFNTQAETFSCTDYQGGPPTEPGTESWIVVTSYKGEGAKYHDDWVAVGDVYTLNDDDERFVADQRISIYSSADKSDDSLLQVVEYSTACTNNLALKDRFGASQVVEWYNVEQGTVASEVNVSFTVGLNVPASVGAGITIDTVTVAMDIGGEESDLTLELGGTFIPAGTILPVTYPASFDVTQDSSYSFRIEIVGTDTSGNTCVGTGSYTFSAGPNMATPAPSSPSISTSAPTMPSAGLPTLAPTEAPAIGSGTSAPALGNGGLGPTTSVPGAPLTNAPSTAMPISVTAAPVAASKGGQTLPPQIPTEAPAIGSGTSAPALGTGGLGPTTSVPGVPLTNAPSTAMPISVTAAPVAASKGGQTLPPQIPGSTVAPTEAPALGSGTSAPALGTGGLGPTTGMPTVFVATSAPVSTGVTPPPGTSKGGQSFPPQMPETTLPPTEAPALATGSQQPVLGGGGLGPTTGIPTATVMTPPPVSNEITPPPVGASKGGQTVPPEMPGSSTLAPTTATVPMPPPVSGEPVPPIPPPPSSIGEPVIMPPPPSQEELPQERDEPTTSKTGGKGEPSGKDESGGKGEPSGKSRNEGGGSSATKGDSSSPTTPKTSPQPDQSDFGKRGRTLQKKKTLRRSRK